MAIGEKKQASLAAQRARAKENFGNPEALRLMMLYFDISEFTANMEYTSSAKFVDKLKYNALDTGGTVIWEEAMALEYGRETS